VCKFLVCLFAVFLTACDQRSNLFPQDESRIFTAVGHGDALFLEKAIKRGLDPNLYSENNGYLIVNAVLSGDEKVLRLLLSAGADVNARKEEGDGAFLRAVILGECDLARILLSAGGDISERWMNPGKAAASPNFKGKDVLEVYYLRKSELPAAWMKKQSCWTEFEKEVAGKYKKP
jgi:hypothetical protein